MQLHHPTPAYGCHAQAHLSLGWGDDFFSSHLARLLSRDGGVASRENCLSRCSLRSHDFFESIGGFSGEQTGELLPCGAHNVIVCAINGPLCVSACGAPNERERESDENAAVEVCSEQVQQVEEHFRDAAPGRMDFHSFVVVLCYSTLMLLRGGCWLRSKTR